MCIVQVLLSTYAVLGKDKTLLCLNEVFICVSLCLNCKSYYLESSSVFLCSESAFDAAFISLNGNNNNIRKQYTNFLNRP